MATVGSFEKPRMLRILLRDYVPMEKQPSSNPRWLSKVVSAIQTHKLLSESFAGPMEQKALENWKSSVDDWVNRLLSLVSSNMPDKCWAGICLMGVTGQECSSDRFLASYSVWLNKLLPHIQQPAGSQLVKEASCTSISDLFTRLSRFPQAKKDGNSHAGKLIQPVIKLLNEDSSEPVTEGALNLLCTIMILFPAAFHSYYDKVETAIASKIFSGESSDSMLKKLAHGLALLPKARGDEYSWSLMMQKLLLSINEHLNSFFQGVEEETKGKQAIRLLVPPGKDHPPPLGGHTGVLDDAMLKSEQLIVSRIVALMCCCCTMLTGSYQVQVNVPIRALLSLVERVLAVDDSLPRTIMPFMTDVQELICLELKDLHSYALDVLIATIKSVRSQLLPHAASILRLVTGYFRRCSIPELRIKLYSISKTLLISMGVGMAMHLAQELVSNASVDLKLIGVEGCDPVPSTPNKAPIQPCARKRKHPTATGVEMQVEHTSLDMGIPEIRSNTPISVKIAALEALGALLAVGGALRSESWRSSIDSLLITTASNACNMGWANVEANCFPTDESTSTCADFQLAAFRALEVSLLSPARVRPAYLAQGLELFRTGKQEIGTKLAEFCAHALLHLEALIHPRALPLDDLPSLSHRFPESSYFVGQKYDAPLSSNIHRTGNIPDSVDDDDDDLCKRWLENGDDVGVSSNPEDQRITTSVYPSESKRICREQEESKQEDNSVAVESENVPGPVVLFQERAASAEVATTHNGSEMEELDRLPVKNALAESDNRLALNTPAASNAEKCEAGNDSDNDSQYSFPGLKEDDFVSDFEASSDSGSD